MIAFCLLLASLALPVPTGSGTTDTALYVEANPSTHRSDLADLVDGEVIAGKSRPGKAFTKKQKQIVKEKNAQENGGSTRCEDCDIETVPGKKHEKGVTPPRNETQVDHKFPKTSGGPGDVDNAQVLCRECNLKKGSKAPAPEELP